MADVIHLSPENYVTPDAPAAAGEAPDAYDARKARELRLLREARIAPSSFAEQLHGIAREKYLTRQRLLGASLAAQGAPPETNWTGQSEFAIADTHFSYWYQRFDMSIKAPPVYPGLSGRKGFTTESWFTCSGMAAITAIMMALQRILAVDVDYLMLDDSYFETRHLMEHSGSRLQVKGGSSFREIVEAIGPPAPAAARILHLDSICATDWLEDLPSALDSQVMLAVFDTTTYPRDSPRIWATILQLARFGVPTALVRSHIKLDCLGTEYGRLGSVTLVEPPLSQRSGGGTIARLRRLMPDAIRVLGIQAMPMSFLPVGESPEFHALSAMRAQRIAENTELLTSLLRRALQATPLYVRDYHHGMFLTVHDDRGMTPEIIRSLADAAMRRYTARGRNGFRTTSFAFDFPIVSDVYDLPTKNFALRIAPSDELAAFSYDLAEDISNELLDYLSQKNPNFLNKWRI